MNEKTFFNLLTEYDQKIGLNVVLAEKNPNLKEAFFNTNDLKNLNLPVGKNYLLVAKSPLEEGCKYDFTIFKVEKNFKRFIQGTMTKISEDIKKRPESFTSTISKSDLFAETFFSEKGKLIRTIRNDLALCYLPSMVELFQVN